MTNFAKVALIGGGALLLWLLNKGSALNRLTFILQGAQVATLGLSPVVNLTIQVTNPTSQSFTVNSVAGTLYLNESPVAIINNFFTQTIQPNFNSLINLPIQPNVPSLASDILNILQGKSNYNVVVRFMGTVNIEGINAPVNLTYQLV